jgi:hypothetical protein
MLRCEDNTSAGRIRPAYLKQAALYVIDGLGQTVPDHYLAALHLLLVDALEARHLWRLRRRGA